MDDYSALLNHFPERIQSGIRAYGEAAHLSPETVVLFAIGYFLKSADIQIDLYNQESPVEHSTQSVLHQLPFPLQRGIEQYALESEYPVEAVVELAITFLLDPDASGFEDCQIGVLPEHVSLLKRYQDQARAT